MKKIPYHQLIFAALPQPALVFRFEDPHFTVIEVNEALLELVGCNREEIIGKTTEEGTDSESGPKNFRNYLCPASIKSSYTNRRKDKVEFPRTLACGNSTQPAKRWYASENIPLLNEDGTVDLVLTTVQDITKEICTRNEKEDLHEKLLKNQQQLRHFVEHNPDGLYSLDKSGKFTSANEGLLKLVETSREELLDKSFLHFCMAGEKEQIIQHFREAVRGNPVDFEGQFISAKGKSLILKISLVPNIVDEEVMGAFGIAKDITAERTSEKLVLEKKKFLEVNASFIRSLLENELETKALEETFAIVGQTVAVDRMYYFGADQDEESGELFISQKIEWTSGRTSPQINNPEMQRMPAGKVRQIMGKLKENLPFTARLSELQEGNLKDLFLKQDIRAMLLLPIFVKNDLYGFIGFDDCHRERSWTRDEIEFLQSLAHYFTNALEKRTAEMAVRQKEMEIEKSEQKFKALVEEGSDLIAILDPVGNFKFISKTATSALGENPEKFVGRNAFEFVHPDDKERLKAEFSELAVKKQKRSRPFRYRNQEGKWRWIETTATNLIKDPAVEGIVVNSRDITTIVEQAREIEQINERYRLAAAATNDLIYDWDLEKNQITRFHKGLKDLFGYPEEVIDQKDFWRENVHPGERQREVARLKEVLANRERNITQTEYRFRRADGSYARVRDKAYILRNAEGEAIRIIGATSDISDITSKEEALRMANKRFEMAMKATNEIIWDWDVENDHVVRSEAFEDVYGYKKEASSSVSSFWLPKVVPKDRERIQASLLAALGNKYQRKWREEYCLKKANGEEAYIIDRGYIVRDKDGKATRVVGAVLDVTESRRLIGEIKKQNEGLREIAWKQSHEVRAPLAKLKGLLHLLQLEEFEELNPQEILDHIYCAADELDKIIREIVTKTENIEISPDSQPEASRS